MPPLRWTNLSRGSDSGLYAAAYRISRDHLLRVRLSALARAGCTDWLLQSDLPDRTPPNDPNCTMFANVDRARCEAGIYETKHFSVRDRLRINICIFLSSGPPIEAFRHCSFAHRMKGAFGAKGVKCPPQR
jgi:hypothetical protein